MATRRGGWARLPAVPSIEDTRWATTAEVCAAGGISGPTAFLWGQKGVLPAPRKVHGGQRGLSSRWPLHAPAQAAWVKLDRGFSFEEIAAALAAGELKPSPSSEDGHGAPWGLESSNDATPRGQGAEASEELVGVHVGVGGVATPLTRGLPSITTPPLWRIHASWPPGVS